MIVPSRTLVSHRRGIAAHRSVRIVRVLSVLSVFCLLHLIFAKTAPLIGAEALALARASNGAVPSGIFSLWVSIAERFATGPFEYRILPICLQVATCAAMMRLIWLMFGDERSVVLGGVWINLTILFGLGGAYAIEASIAAFLLSFSLLILAEARIRRSINLLWPFSIVLAITVWTDPRLVAGAIGLAFVPSPSLGSRRKKWLMVYFLGLSVAMLSAVGRIFLDPTVILPATTQILDIGWVTVQFGIVVFLVTPGLAGFCIGGMLHATNGFLIGERIALHPALACLAGISVLWVILGMPLDLAMVSLPPTIALAAGNAAKGGRFTQKRWAELAAPVALGLTLLVMGMVLAPPRFVLTHIGPVNAMFGWAAFSDQMSRKAESADIGWIVTTDPHEAALLARYSAQVPITDLNGISAMQLDCTKPGFYLVNFEYESAVLQHFGAFSREEEVTRSHREKPLARYVLYRVAQPIDRSICKT